MDAVHTKMSDGRDLCLRPLNNADAPLIEAGIMALSDRSRYFRFFSSFKQAPQSVLDKLITFEGKNHLAWGAVDSSLDTKPAIAAAHIIRADYLPYSRGDFAIAVLDDYHDQGIARAIIACLFSEAVDKGFTHVELDVLSENAAGLSLFRWLGGVSLNSVTHVRHMEIELRPALRILKQSPSVTLEAVFKAF
ncbi:GNAT family N-acetyltransferase [Robiginitomaculum antarcticum]|uniref:GNAT family N-acetyltransferase n=1 Tax=Robiginitomaculum antarcticum TaxID=437507 RepID=UPI0003826F4C|nr:GNAT family N-acetyltransferase [Robiginitomaculum antarcticum]